MKSQRWKEVESLYRAAVQCEPPRRESFLLEACAGDDDLRLEVQSLLESDEGAEHFMEVPALHIEAQSMAADPDSPLLAGRHLSHYRIMEKIGEGGMAVVHKADDLRLERTVALKFLASHTVQDPQAKSRFLREAKAAGALDHPNVCTIYEIDEADGLTFIAMAFVHGESVRDKIAKRPLKLGEAIDIAIQTAQGLQAAHQKGIVHRDIKSANLMINPQGQVKVMDFGLAQLMDASRLTRTMTILGTPSYMSPEQAQQLPVDHRTDIWSVGIVLYEMVTGRVPFEGGHEQAVLYSIVHEDFEPLTALRVGVPIELDRILAKTLAKSPAERYQHADELLVDLRNLAKQLQSSPHVTRVGAGVLPGVASSGVAQRHLKPAVALLGGLLVLSVATIAGLLFRTSTPAVPPPEMRVEVRTPPNTDPLSLAISPDGEKIAFIAISEGRPKLWVRWLDSGSARQLAVSNGQRLFWSPDSRNVGFFAEGKLKRIGIDSESAQELANVRDSGGGAWNRDGVIIFPLFGIPNPGFFRVSAAGGGETSRVTSSPMQRLGPLQFLPDGRHFIYFTAGSPNLRGIYVGGLDAPEPRRLLDIDSSAVFASSGYLLFVRDTTLFAQKFDSVRLELSGNEFPVAEEVFRGFNGSIPVSASAAGPIIYRSGPIGQMSQFIWFDRFGKEIGKVGPPIVAPVFPSISPDGVHVALARNLDGNQDIWLLETAGGRLQRITSDPALDANPIWSPDGRRILFGSSRRGTFDIYQKAPVLGGETLVLATPPGRLRTFPMDVSPDGFLLFGNVGPEENYDIWALRMDGDPSPFPVVQTEFEERQGQFSSDGKWIAYQSNETGPFEIYAQPFPGAASKAGGKTLISSKGGTQVRWSRDGKELFYIAPDGQLMAVPIQFPANGRIEAGTPVPLFDSRVGFPRTPDTQQYMVSSDGQRFLMKTIVEETSTSPITMILNWKPKR